MQHLNGYEIILCRMCIRLKKWTWQAKSLLDCLKSIIKHLKVKNRHLSEVVVIMNSSQKLWNNHSYFKSHFLVAKPIKSIFKRKKVKLFLNVLNHFLYFFLSFSAFTSISILIRSAKKNFTRHGTRKRTRFSRRKSRRFPRWKSQQWQRTYSRQSAV